MKWKCSKRYFELQFAYGVKMHAIILAGGKGTRLLPLTEELPKPLIPVAGMPMVAHVMNALIEAGVTELTFAVSWDTYVPIKACFSRKYKDIAINYSIEDYPLGSAGAIGKACELNRPTRSFFVVNADVITSASLANMRSVHDSFDAPYPFVSILLHKTEMTGDFGIVELGTGRKVQKFLEKPASGTTSSKLINAGIWIFSERVIERLPTDSFARVEETLFPDLVKDEGGLVGITDEGAYWADLGTPEALLAGAEYMRHSTKPLIHESAVIEIDARISNSEIGAGTTVSSNAIISNSLIWDSVTVGANAKIYDSIIGNNAIIEENARISRAVIGPYVQVSAEFHVRDCAMKSENRNRN